MLVKQKMDHIEPVDHGLWSAQLRSTTTEWTVSPLAFGVIDYAVVLWGLGDKESLVQYIRVHKASHTTTTQQQLQMSVEEWEQQMMIVS